MSLTSSRDSWERLVTAVVKKQQIWELCHQQSFTTINSDDLSEQTLSFSSTNYEPSSVSDQSPLLSFKNSSINQVKTAPISNDSSSRSVTRKLFSGWYGRKKPKDHDLVDIPAEFPAGYLGQLERYSYYQLQVATNKFSHKSILGRGRFGVVYKGRLVDGTLVAIKTFKTERTNGRSERGFHREIEVFSIMPEHRNLLSLRGFCMISKEWFLIYPYMVNGSLASCLRERPPSITPLDWGRRQSIALGCARGLSYLHDHCDPKIVHLDVKAANILLDEEYEAIVGDFSLAKLMDHNVYTHATANICGTIGHIAPEHLSTGEASQKTDVFAYGITLLELITGQKPNDLASLANDANAMLLDWLKGLLKEKKLETLVDPNLLGNYVDEEVEQLIQVALLCTQNSALERPRMSEVERWLDGDGLSEKWEEWQKNSLLEVELARYPTTNWIIVNSMDDVKNLIEEQVSILRRKDIGRKLKDIRRGWLIREVGRMAEKQSTRG